MNGAYSFEYPGDPSKPALCMQTEPPEPVIPSSSITTAGLDVTPGAWCTKAGLHTTPRAERSSADRDAQDDLVCALRLAGALLRLRLVQLQEARWRQDGACRR